MKKHTHTTWIFTLIGTIIIIAAFLNWPAKDKIEPTIIKPHTIQKTRIDSPKQTHKHIAAQQNRAEKSLLLQEINLSEEQVCLNATFVAEVKVAPASNQKYSVLINSKPGRRVVLHARKLGAMNVSASLYRADKEEKEKVSTTINVVDCPEQVFMRLQHIQAPFDADAYVFTAHLSKTTDKISKWDWSFGDGMIQQTTSPRVQHGYKMRSQEAPESEMVVTLTATTTHGETIKAHTVITLVNREWMLGQRGVWRHPVKYKSIPNLDDNTLTSPITVRNIKSDARMHFKEVKIRHTSCDRRNETLVTTHRAKDVMGFDVIEPGAIIQGDLKVPLPKAGKWCRWQIEANGSFDDRTAAQVFFSMEHGAPKWLNKPPSREEVKAAFMQSILNGNRHIPYKSKTTNLALR